MLCKYEGERFLSYSREQMVQHIDSTINLTFVRLLRRRSADRWERYRRAKGVALATPHHLVASCALESNPYLGAVLETLAVSAALEESRARREGKRRAAFTTGTCSGGWETQAAC